MDAVIWHYRPSFFVLPPLQVVLRLVFGVVLLITALAVWSYLTVATVLAFVGPIVLMLSAVYLLSRLPSISKPIGIGTDSGYLYMDWSLFKRGSRIRKVPIAEVQRVTAYTRRSMIFGDSHVSDLHREWLLDKSINNGLFSRYTIEVLIEYRSKESKQAVVPFQISNEITDRVEILRTVINGSSAEHKLGQNKVTSSEFIDEFERVDNLLSAG